MEQIRPNGTKFSEGATLLGVILEYAFWNFGEIFCRGVFDASLRRGFWANVGAEVVPQGHPQAAKCSKFNYFIVFCEGQHFHIKVGSRSAPGPHFDDSGALLVWFGGHFWHF